jgi:hypothetical protein
MSSAMDLNASLDDIIKKKRPGNQHKKGNKQQQQQHQQQKQQSKNQKSTKSSQNKGKQQQQQQPQKQVGKKSGILGRLGPNGVHQQSKVNMKQPQRLQLTTASLVRKKVSCLQVLIFFYFFCSFFSDPKAGMRRSLKRSANCRPPPASPAPPRPHLHRKHPTL